MWPLVVSLLLITSVCGFPTEDQRGKQLSARRKRCWICTGDDILFHAPPDRPTRKPARKTQWKRSNNVYNWGYVIPPNRGHSESKDARGVVTGMVNFVNPKGENVQWTYSAEPEKGFKVQEYKIDGINQLQNQKTNVAAKIPLFKGATEIGHLRMVAQEDGQTIYEVDQAMFDAAGSVSQLAFNLGATPLAAVHDARAPPNTQSDAQTRPLLVPQYRARDGTESFYLLVPDSNSSFQLSP